MNGKIKIALIAIPVVIVVALIVIFWKDICLGFSRAGTVLVFVLAALVIGWVLGFSSARKLYKK